MFPSTTAFPFFFLFFLPRPVFGRTGKLFLLVNDDLLPMGCVNKNRFASLKALSNLFFHFIFIVIQDACSPGHVMYFSVKIVMTELSDHVEVINNIHGVKVTLYMVATIQRRLQFSKIYQCFS